MCKTNLQKTETDNSPLVSIIMGVYNAEDTIDRCIESIRSQTYTNWEFIICDDCSTDSTLEHLLRYSNEDKRIHILRNRTNQKLASSLNHCLSKALGEYIARMDADDESLPSRLEKQVDFLETNVEFECVGCSVIIFDDNGDQYIRRRKEIPQKGDLVKDVPFTHPTILMRKTAYDALGGYTVSKETTRAEDLDLWFRFYASGFQGYNIAEPLYRYRESLEDYKKRTLSAGVQTARVFLRGYRLLGFSPFLGVCAMKSILTSLIPNGIMIIYHRACK